MKKLMIILLVLACFSFADTVGYIDSQLILKQYNKAITAQSDLAQKQKELQDILVDKQRELEKAREEGNTDEELVRLKGELESEIQPKREELLNMNKRLSIEIENEIIEATKQIAKQLRIDVVLDKQVVIYGGMDLTSLVLSKLNK